MSKKDVGIEDKPLKVIAIAKSIKDPGLQKGDRVKFIENGVEYEGDVCEFGRGGKKNANEDIVVVSLINGEGVKRVKR